MKGTLGKVIPAANTLTTLCTITNNCSFGEINIIVDNPNSSIVTIDIAIAATATPNNEDYIYKTYPLEAIIGNLTLTTILVSPGELIVVRSTGSDTIFRAYGKETIE